nr:tetratricopeptide repeat protein [Anaerolineae bacterium]
DDSFIEAQRLVDAGLLEVVKGTSGDDRYTQHNLLRAYARALLFKAGEIDNTFNAYTDFYTQVANQFSKLPPEEWNTLTDDLPNIHNVGDTLVEQTKIGQKDNLDRAVAFSYNVILYLRFRREVRGIEWLEMGLNPVRSIRANSEDKAHYQYLETLFLNELGLMWNGLGEKQKALNYYEQALSLFRTMEDHGGEATALSNIGTVWKDLGEKQKALEYYEQALPLFHAIRNSGGEASTLNNIGTAWDDLGEKQKALDYYEQALPLIREVMDRNVEATILSNIGAVWNGLGEKQKALEYFEEALPLNRMVGDLGGEALILNNIGLVCFELGEKQKALEYYEQALPLLQAMGNRDVEATTLSNMGAAWDDLGEKQKALEYYEQALNLYRVTEDRNGEGKTFNNIGLVMSDLGETGKAIENYKKALFLFGVAHDREGEATTRNYIGTAWSALGDKRKAIAFYRQALSIYHTIGSSEGEAKVHGYIGIMYKNLGQIENAIAEIREAIAILKQHNLTYSTSGESVEHYEEVLQLWESERKNPYPQFPPVNEGESQDEQAQVLAQIQVESEDELRAALKRGGMDEAAIEQTVVEIIAANKPQPSAPNTLPVETVRAFGGNTIAVMTTATDKLSEWQDRLQGVQTDFVGRELDWVQEVAFVNALLSVLDGQSPVLPTDNPYHQVIEQVLAQIKGTDKPE